MERFRNTAKRLFTSDIDSQHYRNAAAVCEPKLSPTVESASHPRPLGEIARASLASFEADTTSSDDDADASDEHVFDSTNNNIDSDTEANGSLTNQSAQECKEGTSCRGRKTLLRSFTLASIPSTFEKTARMFQLAKAPLKVKFLVSPKGAAWFLEDDIERRVSLGCDTHTDNTPFNYNTSQTYYSSAPCSPTTESVTRKKKVSCGEQQEMSPRPSVSLENLHRLRLTSSKLTLNEQEGTNDNNAEEEDDVEEDQKPLGGLNRGPLRRSFSFSQRNFRRNAVVEPPTEGVTIKAKRKRDNILEVFLRSVERQDEDQIKKILEATDVDLNELNDDGFTALDVSVMLHSKDITSLLLEHNARESDRLSAHQLENYLKMLETNAVEQVELHVADLVNKGSSDVKDSERQLKECEWRLHLLKEMLSGFQQLEPPPIPNTVLLSAASETSLLVRYTEPAHDENNIVTKYRVQWSRDKAFANLDGEYFCHSVLNRQYIIEDLQKSTAYYVRVCAGNIRGYGPWLMSTPPCVVPSSWHEIDDSTPRFQGKLDRISQLFQDVQVYQTTNRGTTRQPQDSKAFRLRRSPQLLRKRSGSWHVPTDEKRGDGKKRSFAKYAKLLTSTPKFVKELKRGIYLTTIFYTEDDKILVTLDDNLPMVQVDEGNCSSFNQEFQWLLKVGCTWHDVRMLKDQVERNLSSTSLLLRGRLLQSLETLQVGVGCEDLGQVHYQIVKDKNGTNIVIITKKIKNPSFIRSRTLSMKWSSLSKLQKKTTQKENEDESCALNRVVSSVQEVISYHQHTKKPLDKGLYLGFLKIRTSLDTVHITVPKYSPNILPYVKVRDNPHVSREEWEWLTGLNTMHEEEISMEQLPDFQCMLENAVKNLVSYIGISQEDCSNYRIYDREVVELSSDVSMLVLIPPPEDVCSCPGQEDPFSDNQKFISVPVPVFEMNVMRTYQNQFICHYSRLSSILETASLINQHESRKAITEPEVTDTRETQDQLDAFQKELDETWKGMRWLLDILHHARDRDSVNGVPLELVFDNSRPTSPGPYDSHRKHTERKNGTTEGGVLKIYSACETGLAPGKCVKLHVLPYTTVQQVVHLVVRQFEKLVQETNPDMEPLSEEKIKEFCLVAVIGAREKCLKDDYKILQLQNPWTKGKLFVRLRVEAVAADNRSQSTSV